MKKLRLIVALCALVFANRAIASLFSFEGVWNIFDQGGFQQNIGDDPASGIVSFDALSGTGTDGRIDGHQVWQGFLWSATDLTLTQLTSNTYEVTYLWSGFGSASVANIWEINPTGAGSFSVVTLDGDGDGTPGNRIDNGSWPGFSMTLDGVLTPVPIPPALPLLGLGLLWLVGIATRKTV